jgi:lambda repressor-like predicted transcriptional regulator
LVSGLLKLRLACSSGLLAGFGDHILMGMAQRSQQRLYEETGLTDVQRDQLIYQLRSRRWTYAKIARRVGVSVGAVRASLARSSAKLDPCSASADDWDADLR